MSIKIFVFLSFPKNFLRIEKQVVKELSVFVCVDVLRPNQPNGVMSSAVSLPSHTYRAGSVL